MPIYLNGKFYGSPINGVYRVSDLLIRQLDLLAGEGRIPAHWQLRLLAPEQGSKAPAFRHIETIPQRRGNSQLWEQLVLPRVARDGVLVSLANVGPVLHRRKLTMVHDAQFLISPGSYPLKLRIGYRMVIPIGARTSRTVLTVSEYARDSLESYRFAIREHIAVLHNSAEHMLEVESDRALANRLGLQRGGFCVIFGSAATYKNVQVVFDAFMRPELRDLTLVVIGPGADRLRAGGLTPPPQAMFVGGVDDATLRALYEDALCLLFPSRTEGFGLPPLEAMTCGGLVISAPAGAMPEVCRDAVIYADTGDAASWAVEVDRLRHSPQLAERKRREGRERAAVFTWRSTAERLVQEIAAVAGA